MNTLPTIDEKLFSKFGPYTLVTGILLVVLGTVAILLLGVMSLGATIFSAWKLLIGGVFWVFTLISMIPRVA